MLARAKEEALQPRPGGSVVLRAPRRLAPLQLKLRGRLAPLDLDAVQRKARGLPPKGAGEASDGVSPLPRDAARSRPASRNTTHRKSGSRNSTQRDATGKGGRRPRSRPESDDVEPHGSSEARHDHSRHRGSRGGSRSRQVRSAQVSPRRGSPDRAGGRRLRSSSHHNVRRVGSASKARLRGGGRDHAHSQSFAAAGTKHRADVVHTTVVASDPVKHKRNHEKRKRLPIASGRRVQR